MLVWSRNLQINSTVSRQRWATTRMAPSNNSSLRARMGRILEQGFSALDIAEPLPSYERQRSAEAARRFMREHELLVMGVRTDACISGYVHFAELTDDTCEDHAHPFTDENVVEDSASLPEVITALETQEYCFVSVLGSVGAVITRYDIDKPPVRMWLFGIVTIMDMYITRKIDDVFPEGSWQEQLAPARLQKAINLRDERMRRHQRSRLVDCLQLTDKARILMQDPGMMEELNFTSKRDGERAIKAFESLRNNLAHVQSVVAYDWETVVALAKRHKITLSRI